MSITTVRIGSEADIVRVRQVAATLTRAFGLEKFAHTRAVTACLELARNALQYAGGGRIAFGAVEGRNHLMLTVSVRDQGPGIKDVERLLSGRAVHGTDGGLGGRGMGLGLRGVKRLAQEFDLVTGPEGTKIDIAFAAPNSPGTLAETVEAATDALMKLGKADPAAELAQQNQQLAEALAERELLINEVHHRTGNNLALILGLIQMSRRSAKEPETGRILAELEGRVHAVAKVHEELQKADNVDRLLIIPFLKKVASHGREAFSSEAQDIDIHVEGDDIWLHSAAAVDIGLIVGELITNAFKHAFAGRTSGRIAVSFRHEENPEKGDDHTAFCLIVADNGHGLPEDAGRPERSNSLGWRMIRAMTARHDGTIETDGSNGFRTVIHLGHGIAAD
ncbi:sensor histidine kinase [Pacificimonas flava]|uniref:histidine kinase n=1 Tax=Pacificimonas flava TaxID=1234595 RepID=M2TQ71_9SPHN|nr:ATP-binding protein [Pacificimonas flava]EMD83896.1 putative signal transduction histidine kinase [Pacificimonas flava]MBB5281129.1 two-component sensor histidine kinase [Pacificimonas flava]